MDLEVPQNIFFSNLSYITNLLSLYINEENNSLTSDIMRLSNPRY
jgi:hypothetical protein